MRALLLCALTALFPCSALAQDAGSLVTKLGDGDPLVRRAAAQELGRLGPDARAAVPALTKALNDPNEDVRIAAAQTLGSLGSDAAPAIPALITLAVQPGRGPTRLAAARTLAAMGPVGRVSLILHMSRVQSAWARAGATQAIGKLSARDRDAAPILVEALSDPKTRAIAAAGLMKVGAPPTAAAALGRVVRDKDPGARLAALMALRPLGSQAAPALEDLIYVLAVPDSKARRVALELLGAIGSRAQLAIPAIVKLLAVYTEAADALVRIGPDAVPALMHILIQAPGIGGAGERVARVLGRIGEPAIPTLVNALAHDRFEVRWHTVLALTVAGRHAALAAPGLILCFKEKRLQRKAARAVASIGPAAVPALVAALEDPVSGVREAAAFTLGEIGFGAREAAPALLEALNDKNHVTRWRAARSLGFINADPAVAVPALIAGVRADKLEERPTQDALTTIGAPAVPALTKALSEGKPRFRRWAVETLRKIGTPKAAVPAMAVLLRDPNLRLREEAARTLSTLGPMARTALAALIKALTDAESTSVRQAAAKALGSMGQVAEPVVLALARALSDKDSWVRQTAAQSLAMLGSGAALARPVLLSALAKSDWKHAARALAAQGPKAVPDLIQTLENPQAGPGAAHTLGLIGWDAAAAVPALTRALTSSNERLRREALIALGGIGPPAASAAAAMASTLSSDLSLAAVEALGRLGSGAAPAVPALLELLRDPAVLESHYRTYKLIDTLGQIGPAASAAFPELVKALKNRSGSVRVSAERALRALGLEVLPQLVALVRDRKLPFAARLIGELGPRAAPVVPVLGRALQVYDPGLAPDLTLALARIGPASTPVLIEALGHHHERIRQLAARALAQVSPPPTDALMRVLQDARLRLGAIRALRILGGNARHRPAAIRLIKVALKYARIRREALKAIIELRGPEAVGYLAHELRIHPKVSVREDAAEGLERIGQDHPDQAAAGLEAALHDRAWKVRLAAIHALGSLPPTHSVPALVLALQDSHAALRRAAELELIGIGRPAVRDLAALLEHPTWWVRLSAVRVLGGILAPTGPALSVLRRAAKDTHPRVKAAAASALAGR